MSDSIDYQMILELSRLLRIKSEEAESLQVRLKIAEDALRECEEYFDDRADAETFTDSGTHPNAEMRLLITVREALTNQRRINAA